MKCQALPSFLIVMLGVAVPAPSTKATSPSRAAQPLGAVSRHGWLLGTRRRVTHKAPARSGSNARAVAVHARGGSYNGKSSMLVGTAAAGDAASDSSGFSSGLELQLTSVSARPRLSTPRATDRMPKGEA